MFVKLGITGKESSAFEDLYGTSKIDKQHFIGHTCTCITAIKQYYRFDQSVSNLMTNS
jgi:hypothetical protein